MEKVQITYDEIDEVYAVIDEMEYLAEDYCPSAAELKTMTKDLKKYIPFLTWIDETGIETEDNAPLRAIIRTLLTEYVEQVEE